MRILKRWTQEEDKILIDNYDNKNVLFSCQLLPHRTRDAIKNRAVFLELTVKRFEFPLIWSPEMAYFVGFFAADGNMGKRTEQHRGFLVRIKLKDEYNNLKLLNKIKTLIPFGNIVKSTIYDKRVGKNYHNITINFYNKKFYNDLLSIGLEPAKSKILKWPTVPEEYFWDFIRGFFDGDGHIGYNKRTKIWYCNFTSASLTFLERIKDECFKRGVTFGGSIYKITGKKCFRLSYSKYDTLKIGEKIYYNNNIDFKLDNKYERFLLAFGEK